MQISLNNATKSFGREVVFRNVEHVFASGSRTALLGPNGSGKSTLLMLVGGALMPSKGSVVHAVNDTVVPEEEVYRHVAIAAPYLGLYEELSLAETVVNHARFKPLKNGLTATDVARIAYLENALEKPVRNFSSGMKQRLKLALAILSDTPLLLLDEPTSNIDAKAVAWYSDLLREHVDQRTLLVASNRQEAEFALCTERVEVERWK